MIDSGSTDPDFLRFWDEHVPISGRKKCLSGFELTRQAKQRFGAVSTGPIRYVERSTVSLRYLTT